MASDSLVSDRFSQQGNDSNAVPLFAGNNRKSRPRPRLQRRIAATAGLTWMLSRFHVQVERYPAWQGRVRVETWPAATVGYGIATFLLRRTRSLAGKGVKHLADYRTAAKNADSAA